MAWAFTGLGSGSSPTMIYDLDITQTSRTASTVTYTVTAYAHLSSQTYDYFNATVTVYIQMSDGGRAAIGTMGTFPKGAGTKSCSISYTANASAGTTSVGYTFSATQSLGGTSSSSTGYVGGYGGTVGASVYATTPSQPDGWSFWDGTVWGTNQINPYYRENIGTSPAMICWNPCSGANGTVGYQLAYYTSGDPDWTYISLGNQTSYNITFLSGKSDIKFAVRANNTVGGYTTWSSFVYSPVYYKNTMNAPAVSSSSSVSYLTTSAALSVGAATDNMGTSMTYTITGLNYTTLNASAGQASITTNKWLAKKYSKALANSNTVPTLADISGLTPVQTKLVADATTDLVAAAGWGGTDSFIGYFTTNVYTATAKSFSVTMNSDDTSNFYLNGVSIGTVTTYNTAKTFTVSLPIGWSKIEVLMYEGGGGEFLTLSPAINTQVTTMVSEVGAGSTSSGTVTINTNNGTTGLYMTLANLKTAALAGATASDTSLYKSTLDFRITAVNGYGTVRTTDVSIPIDLGKDAPVNTKPTLTVDGTSTSTYTINSVAYYFPAYKPVTLTVGSVGTDALGRKVSYDLYYSYNSVNTLIKNSGMQSAGFTMTANGGEIGLGTTSKSVSFYVVPKTYNGVTTLSGGASGASTATTAITAHYYNKPTVSTSGVNRTSGGATISVIVTRNTSLTVTPATNTLTNTGTLGSWSKSASDTATAGQEKYTLTGSGLNDADAPVVTITALDPIGTIINNVTQKTTYTVSIARFIPTMAVREKGVGINAIPDDTAKLKVGGNARIEGNITITGDIYTNGTSAANTAIALSNGSNTVTSSYTAPLEISSINGKTSINLLGGHGNLDNTMYHDVNNVSLSLDGTNFVVGSDSLKVTATGTGTVEHYAVLANGTYGLNFKNFKVNHSSYYVIVGCTRPNVGQSALRLIRWSDSGTILEDRVGTKITDTTKFSNVAMLVASGTTDSAFELRLNLYNTSGSGGFAPATTAENALFDAFRMYEVSSTEYATLSGLTADQLAAKYPYMESIAPIINPTLSMGNSNLVLQTSLYNMFGVQDQIFVDTDGKLKKKAYVREIVFTGNTQDCSCVGSYTGWKTLKVNIPTGLPQYSADYRFVRHNGEVIIPLTSGAWASYDARFAYSRVDNAFEVAAFYGDSGWGDNYTPTADEVRAYFNGYKMYVGGGSGAIHYNGTGQKAWCFVGYDGSYQHVSIYVDDCLKLPAWQISNAYGTSGRMPWRLIYKIPNGPEITEVEPVGEIMLQPGSNTVTATQGIIINEPYVVNNGGDGYYYINDINSGHRTKYVPKTFLYVSKNGVKDPNWVFGNTRFAAEAYTFAQLPAVNFDPTAAYTITYSIPSTLTTPLDTYNVSIVNSFSALVSESVRQLSEQNADIAQLFSLDRSNVKVVGQGYSINGLYVRYSDGLQICWRHDVNPANYWSWSSAAIAGGTYFYTAGPWTFPASFISAPVGCATGDIGGAGPEHHYIYAFSSTACSTEHGIFGVDPRNANLMYTHYLAIGRWK